MSYQEDAHKIYELAYILGINLTRKDGLLLPVSFFEFKNNSSKQEFDLVCNGAGPKGFGLLVPDSMYFLDMKPVFDGHDYCYDTFKTKEGKELADMLMKVNMMSFIDDNSTSCFGFGRSIKFLRKRRALKYYYAVDLGGKWFHA